MKPILRPLSDMTDEEAEYWKNITDGNLFPTLEQSAKEVKYFLHKRIDLFGLIEAGLAIDKTTLK